jgi:hypothetical protein
LIGRADLVGGSEEEEEEEGGHLPQAGVVVLAEHGMAFQVEDVVEV